MLSANLSSTKATRHRGGTPLVVTPASCPLLSVLLVTRRRHQCDTSDTFGDARRRHYVTPIGDITCRTHWRFCGEDYTRHHCEKSCYVDESERRHHRRHHFLRSSDSAGPTSPTPQGRILLSPYTTKETAVILLETTNTAEGSKHPF